ncbi:NAD(P)H-dependent oxidoreductase subunit E, partial [Oligoflexia bacterium]|nr:NAD(P)H-dependent oxidoreductase subunit E [Oligoflexia bacterium]
FYTMYYQKPVGKYHIQLCRTLSCAICGAKQLVEYVKERLKISSGEMTDDGLWSFEQVECLGSCGTAPVCEINDTYFENMTPAKLGEVMDRIEKEKPDLRFSTIRGELGAGLKGHPKSQIL